MADIRNNPIFVSVLCITLAFGGTGWWWPDFLQHIQYPLLILLLLLIGLPHGATDFLLFRHLRGPVLSNQQVFRFFFYYLLTVISYLVVWLFWPIPAFLLFLLISTYHFGQSNWEYITLPRWPATVLNILWGTVVLGGSVLWHWEESSIIISQLIGPLPSWTSHTMENIQWLLLLSLILSMSGLWLARKITAQQLLVESGKLGVLTFLFLNTPMLVGFTLYFSLWHSMSSLLSQITFYRRKWPAFTLLDYYRQAAPFTLLAIVGLLGMILGQSILFPDISFISILLIFIACITLPHIFLVEESYH